MSDNKKLILKVACLPWANESRDKRELSVCRELGYDVAVLAKGEPEDRGRIEDVAGFKVYRYSVRPFGGKLSHSLSKVLSLFTWASYIRKLSPYALTCHDISALTIGWLSTLFLPKAGKPKLIYDSHEFEIGRSEKRSKLAVLGVTYLERFLMSRCEFSIMVNDSIADEVQRIHRLAERPVVVRNTPNYWHIDKASCRDVRRELLDAFSLQDGEAEPFLIMYHGGLLGHRGIETVLKVAAGNSHVRAVVLGNGKPEYVAELKNIARELSVEDRVLFHPAVPIDVLWKYVGAVDLSLVMIEGIVKNHYFSLPNKFFESIQSLTPLVTSNFPELKRIVEGYGIGLSCDPEDIDAVSDCVERMRTDRAFYESCCENLRLAKEELCWEKEKHNLINAYKKI